jgi:site-specific DNA-methyltransferase (adenine-specific)
MTRPYRLYNGDCLDILKTLPMESIDLIFADPPYKLSNGGFTCKSGKKVSVDKGDWDKSEGFTLDTQFHQQWLSSCQRVLKPHGTLWVTGTYHNIFICGFTLQCLGYHILNDICWFKPNTSPNLSCRYFTASHETLIWARKSKNRYHTFNYLRMKEGEFPEDDLKELGKQMKTVWKIPKTPASEKICGNHPTQKPLALLNRVILSSTHVGDIVLDPFCGSGTTGVAAIQNGRKFVGIEKDHHFITISKKRLENQWDMTKNR